MLVMKKCWNSIEVIVLFFLLSQGEVAYSLEKLEGISNFTLVLKSVELVNPFEEGFISNTYFDLSNELEKNDIKVENSSGTDKSIKVFVYRINDLTYINVKCYTNDVFFIEDEVYIKGKITEEIWKNLLRDLSHRISLILKGENPSFYISFEDQKKKEFLKNFTDEEIEKMITEDESKVENIEFFSLFDAGYFYPLGIEIGILHLFRVFHSYKFSGIGVGIELLKLYPSYTNTTNSLFSLLPVSFYFPVLVSKRSVVSDLMLKVEWSWYNSSINNTNTNNSGVSQGESLSYLSLGVVYYFPYITIDCGLRYHYLQNDLIFYIGGRIYIGRYIKN